MPRINDLIVWLRSQHAIYGNAELTLFKPEFGRVDLRNVEKVTFIEKGVRVVLLDLGKPIKR